MVRERIRLTGKRLGEKFLVAPFKEAVEVFDTK